MDLTEHHLCRRLPYGLKLARKGYQRPYDMVIFNDSLSLTDGITVNYVLKNEYEDFKPILHPLSDLTKPIKIKGYNNGEEFVPALILYRIAAEGSTKPWNPTPFSHYKNLSYNWSKEDGVLTLTITPDDERHYILEVTFWEGNINLSTGYHSQDYRLIACLEQEAAFELFNQLHFVRNEPEGTWIDVNTLDKNPYS